MFFAYAFDCKSELHALNAQEAEPRMMGAPRRLGVRKQQTPRQICVRLAPT
jgi:hypothetical protein